MSAAVGKREDRRVWQEWEAEEPLASWTLAWDDWRLVGNKSRADSSGVRDFGRRIEADAWREAAGGTRAD